MLASEIYGGAAESTKSVQKHDKRWNHLISKGAGESSQTYM